MVALTVVLPHEPGDAGANVLRQRFLGAPLHARPQHGHRGRPCRFEERLASQAVAGVSVSGRGPGHVVPHGRIYWPVQRGGRLSRNA